MQVIQIEGAKKPLFSWCPDLQPNAMAQMETIAKLPFVEHTAIMPDGHLGMENGACIGSVIACKDVLVPNFVGVDIFCGMASVRTDIKVENLTMAKKEAIHAAISKVIPTGFSHNDDKRCNDMRNRYGQQIKFLMEKYATDDNIVTEEDIFSQLSTLGGGNHALECQYDDQGYIWFMVHSGSRNIGKKVCDHFDKVAETLNKQWYSNCSNIPFLPNVSDEGKRYMAWTNICGRFSFLNRKAMIEDIMECIKNFFPNAKIITRTVSDKIKDDIINLFHNYVTQENHFGKNWFVHRKGAVLASKGVIGIVPGSQSTPTYITEGLGNPESLNSCSHGAGRTMGRKQFNIANQSRLHEIEDDMTAKGIVFSRFKKAERSKDDIYDISESSGAYKNIEKVIEEEKDLVKTIVKLTPIINWKG